MRKELNRCAPLGGALFRAGDHWMGVDAAGDRAGEEFALVAVARNDISKKIHSFGFFKLEIFVALVTRHNVKNNRVETQS